jgi:hypothetical protein
MIAGRHDVRAGCKRRAEHFFRDAEASGGVLSIYDDEIEVEVGAQTGKLFEDSGTACPANHIAEKEKSHLSCRKKKSRAKARLEWIFLSISPLRRDASRFP